jgi:toxin-antitoxin system PIN domain toxin
MRDLLDASVWLPLSVPDHAHYPRARRYWDDESASELAFCRVTALALLRHLTNPRILGDVALDGRAAWQALETWLALPHVTLLAEPPGLDELLAQWAVKLDLRGGQWTDAYLAAFAAASGCRLVAFDGDFHRYPGIEFLHLTA